MHPFPRNLMWIPLALALAGCGKSPAPDASNKGSAPSAAQTVVWPELKAFDALSEKAEGWVEKKDAAGARAGLAELAAAVQALTASAIPANAHNPLIVKELMADAAELAQALGKAGDLPDEGLLSLLGAMHPLAEKFMTESGMPHSHDAHEGHDHGHEHDHDHGKK